VLKAANAKNAEKSDLCDCDARDNFKKPAKTLKSFESF